VVYWSQDGGLGFLEASMPYASKVGVKGSDKEYHES